MTTSNQTRPPVFSIITVTRNHAKGLRRTLASISAQTFRDFEIIVVDGNSTDETPEVIDGFRDLPMRCFKDVGRGVYAAMNQGVREISGIWGILMNAGDCFYDETVLEKFTAPVDAELAYGRAWLEDRSRSFVYRPFDEIWKGNVFCHQALFARVEIMKRFPFRENLRVVADYAFYIESLKAGHRFVPIDLDVAVIEPGGISSGSGIRRTIERYPIAKNAFPEMPVTRYYFRLFLQQIGAKIIPGRTAMLRRLKRFVRLRAGADSKSYNRSGRGKKQS